MVVDGFKIFAFHGKRGDARVLFEHGGDVAHHVFHKFGVFVGVFGYKFFVGAFEQAVELAGGLIFHPVDCFFDGDGLAAAQGEGKVRALVVRTVVGDFFGAGAKAGNGDDDFQAAHKGVFAHFANEGYIVIQQREAA